jgi:hypothetical protein
MNGNLQLEINPEQINLLSFKPKERLNSKFFPNENKLNSRVRLKLLDIADDFIEYLNIPFVKPLDIVLVGSIVSYQWSKYSDVDLHIVYDFDDISDKKVFVREYFDSKKNLWNSERKIKIYGYEVECYVEDIHDNTVSNGRYSIEKNTWSQFPSKLPPIKWEKYYIKEKSAKFIDLIEKYENEFEENKDNEHKLLELVEKTNKLWTKIKAIRKDSVEKQGEMGSGNIIFKVLRRTHYLNRLYKLKMDLYTFNRSIR